jgi:hypothetical protein
MILSSNTPIETIIWLVMIFIITGVFVAALVLICVHIAQKGSPSNRVRNSNHIQRHTGFVPSKQGECYDILSKWSMDRTSHEMIIHNLNPNATEAKMVIHKLRQGWVMRLYDWGGNLLQENSKITTHELANKFYAMRQPPPVYQPQPKEKPVKTYTIEIK